MDTEPRRTRVADIVTLASRLSGAPVSEILGKRRHRSIVRVRQAVFAVALEHGHSASAVRHRMGLKCHSTVLHGRKVAAIYARTEPEFGRFLHELREQAKTCDWFLTNAEVPANFNLVFSYQAPKRPKVLKPINDTRPGEQRDGAHIFHDHIADGTRKFAQALADNFAQTVMAAL